VCRSEGNHTIHVHPLSVPGAAGCCAPLLAAQHQTHQSRWSRRHSHHPPWHRPSYSPALVAVSPALHLPAPCDQIPAPQRPEQCLLLPVVAVLLAHRPHTELQTVSLAVVPCSRMAASASCGSACLKWCLLFSMNCRRHRSVAETLSSCARHSTWLSFCGITR
jgi:hypothetical protein